MSTFVNNLCPIERAVFSLYPARIAACVAFKSIRYSSTNFFCFSVNLDTSPPRYIIVKNNKTVLLHSLISLNPQFILYHTIYMTFYDIYCFLMESVDLSPSIVHLYRYLLKRPPIYVSIS